MHLNIKQRWLAPSQIYSHTKTDVIIFYLNVWLQHTSICSPVLIFYAYNTHTHTDSQVCRPSSSLLDFLLPVGMYLCGLAWWIRKLLLLLWLGVGHLFMTPVMAVIVTVEITCQEDPCSKPGEGVPLLTRGDRGTGKRTRGVERDCGELERWGWVWEALMTSLLIISCRGLWDNSAVNAT